MDADGELRVRRTEDVGVPSRSLFRKRLSFQRGLHTIRTRSPYDRCPYQGAARQQAPTIRNAYVILRHDNATLLRMRAAITIVVQENQILLPSSMQ